jgi:hypothetical protein
MIPCTPFQPKMENMDKQMSQNKAEENFPFEDATALQFYPPFDQRILLIR